MGFTLGKLISDGLAHAVSTGAFMLDLASDDGSSAAKRIEDESVLITANICDPEGKYRIGRIHNEPKLFDFTFGLSGTKTILVELEPRDADIDLMPACDIVSKSKIMNVARQNRYMELKFVDQNGAVIKAETIKIHA